MTKWASEAERLKAYRTRLRGRPPRSYHSSYPTKGERQFGGPGANAARAEAIRRAWEDPLRRALMRKIKLDEGKNAVNELIPTLIAAHDFVFMQKREADEHNLPDYAAEELLNKICSALLLLPCPICDGREGCDHTVPERISAWKQRP